MLTRTSLRISEGVGIQNALGPQDVDLLPPEPWRRRTNRVHLRRQGCFTDPKRSTGGEGTPAAEGRGEERV